MQFSVTARYSLIIALRGVYGDTTQLNSTDPVEQCTAKSIVFLIYKLSQLGHYVH